MATLPKMLLTRRWPRPVERALQERYDVTVDGADRPMTADALRRAMLDFDVICPTVTDRIDAAILSTPGARVRLIANYGAGTDHIDLRAAQAAKLIVTNTPDILTDATAELALLLMLMASRRTSEGERELRSGAWAGWKPTHLVGQSLAGKTLGLVGFGRIGQATAALAAKALGVQIIYFSRRRIDAGVEERIGARYVPSLDALLREADIVSLHCPGGLENHHLINSAMLAKMKRSAILINTARGSVVDEAALIDALASQSIWAAGLDVFEHEPAISEALCCLPNAVLLPHLGSAVDETRIAMGMRALANVDCFFAGLDCPDRVA